MPGDRILPTPADWAAAESRLPARAPLDDAFMARPLLATIRDMAEQYPDNVAVIDDHGTLTYAELVDAVERLGREIARCPAPAGPVAVALRADRASVIAFLGAIAANRPSLALDAGLPRERLDALMARARAPIVVGAPDWRPRLVDGVPASSSLGSPLLGQDDVAIILPTSGSTGQPRLIAHSQRTMANRAYVRLRDARLTSADRVFSAGAIAAFGTLAHVLTALCAGAGVRLMDLRVSGFRGMLTALEKDRITLLRGGVSIPRALVGLDRDHARSAARFVRMLWLGGEMVNAADLAIVRDLCPSPCEIVVGYGATECASVRRVVADDAEPETTGVSVGVPDAGATALLIDDDARIVANGGVGELVMRSRYNALGEWVDGALITGRLMPDPHDPTHRVYFTGDLARQLPDGGFVILGRRDRMVKIAGQRIEPAEIERALLGIEGVREAAVSPLDRGGSQVLLAFVVAPAGHDTASWRARLREILPSHMVPARIVVVDAFPRLGAGKIDIQALLRAHPF